MATTLIIDIETVGEEWEAIDDFTQDMLTAWIKKESKSDSEFESELANIKEGLGLSPLTGEIVAIGIHDYERNKSAVYYQGEESKEEKIEDGVTYQSMSEGMMLHRFWEIAQKYTTVVTFNGYSFDVPYLMIRSAVHGVKPSVNLMTNRYLSMQRGAVAHIDLQDQLCFYGASRRRGSLHMWTRVFGIESPKSENVNGHEVSKLFKEKRFVEIARYNAADIKATAELYTKWVHFLKF